MRNFAVIWLLLVAAARAVPAVSAQEVLPDAPAELEDFRLDKPAPEAEVPAPTTQSPVTTTPPPSAPTTVQPEAVQPAPAARPSAEAAPVRRSNPSEVSRSTATPRAASASPVAAPEAASSDIAPSQAEPSPSGAGTIPGEGGVQNSGVVETPLESDANAGREEGAQPTRDGWSIWFAIAALAALLAGILLILALRRQRKAATSRPLAQAETEPVPASEEMEIEGDPHIEIVEPEAVPAMQAITRPATAEAAPKPRAKPELEMRFVPEAATLGIVNLTLRGELKIVNLGKAMARNVRLRTAAICASNNQPAMIAAFNTGEMGPEADSIDNIRKGERVSIAIEVSLPRSELESYNVAGRQICVPILLGEIAYTGMQANSDQAVQVAAMVGREANPPQDKMGPLRIDIGPRSYDALGQRPVSV